jgi:hypothetical protein
MPLFDTRTDAQKIADEVLERLETDFRARTALNNYLLGKIFNGSLTKEVLAALADKGSAVMTYFQDNAAFINARQPNSIPVDKIGSVLKNPDGTASDAVVVDAPVVDAPVVDAPERGS